MNRYEIRDSHTNRLISTHATLAEALRALDSYQRSTHRPAWIPCPTWLAR